MLDSLRESIALLILLEALCEAQHNLLAFRSASTRQSTNVEVFRRACGQVPWPPFPLS